MEKVYTMNKKTPPSRWAKGWPVFAAAIFFISLSFPVFAQSDLVWNGAENTRFTNENNWDPAGSPVGNNLTIPMRADSSLAPFEVLVSGSEHITVNWLEIAYATENQYQPTVTIDLDDDTVTFLISRGSASNADYGYTGTIVKKGHYRVDRENTARLDDMNAWLRVEGGIAEFNNLLMGNSNTPERGGKIYISGGELRLRTGGFGRMYTARENGQVEITGKGKLTINNNFTAPTENWINGGEDYLIKRTYDAVENITTFIALHKDSVFDILNTNTQVLILGEEADTLELLESGILNSPTIELTWKYRKAEETTYTAFTGEGVGEHAFAPVFTEQGTFYVICEGIDGDNVVQTSEVMFVVGSDVITLSPLVEYQYVRVGETGVPITASAAGGEWKYATTQGGPYMSLDEMVSGATENTVTPVFNVDPGNYYLVYEVEIGGEPHRSFEMLYVVEATSTAGKVLTWTGLYSTDATYQANWSPVANPLNNTLNVNVVDSTVTMFYPVFSGEGNFSISSFTFAPNSHVIFDGPDTIQTTGSNRYVQGTVDLKKGVMTARPTESNQYFRIERPEAIFTLYGTSQLVVYNLLMGSHSSPTSGTGGHLHIRDNARVHCQAIDRFSTVDSTYSRIYLYDNGQIWIAGDVRSAQQSRIEMGKYFCPVEDWEPYMFFDGEYTILKARNTNSFSIGNDQNAYTTAGNPLEEPITLVNTDGITEWEWKWSNSPHGPFNSFAPEVKNELTLAPSFEASGTYYVIAETGDGIQTSNFKPVVVIELAVDPATAQEVALNTDGTALTAVIPAQFTVTDIAWYYRLAGSEEYVETFVHDSVFVPNFSAAGVYEVFYMAEVLDGFSVQYFLMSNSVTITAGNVGVGDQKLNALNIYPNPTTTGMFYVDGGKARYRVEIFDMAGKIHLSRQIDTGGRQAIRFDRKGIYIVKVNSDEETKIGRLIVQ